MKIKHMDKLINHFDYYFEQEEPKVYHNDNMYPHIDILRYKPTLKYPFYKLVTMGASDYKLSKSISKLFQNVIYSIRKLAGTFKASIT